jgi:cytochrome c peroxidase
MKRWTVAIVPLLAAAFLVALFETPNADDDVALLKQAQTLFNPLPQTTGPADTQNLAARAALGRMLFFDPRWTLEGNVSCATCHQPALYGTDGLAKSIGVLGQVRVLLDNFDGDALGTWRTAGRVRSV